MSNLGLSPAKFSWLGIGGAAWEGVPRASIGQPGFSTAMAKQTLYLFHTFDAPRSQVFAFFADPATLGKLWGGRWTHVSASPDPAHPHGVGSTRDVRAGAFSYRERVVSYQPCDLIEHQVIDSSAVLSHLARVTFADFEGGTRVEYRIEFESRFAASGAMFAATLKLSWTLGVARAARSLS